MSNYDWATEGAISTMEWSPELSGPHIPLSSEHESLSKPTHQNETLFGDSNTSTAEEAPIPPSGTGMTRTRGPGPLGQFQKHFTKPIVPFLTMVYLRAEGILQAARSVHVFHMQSLYIARQALHLVILLNDLVDGEEGPDDMQQTERIDLEDDLIELLEAMEEWGAGLAEGGHVDYEQGRLKIQHHYAQIFKERFYFHNMRDATNDPIYQKLLAYDERTIQGRQRCQGPTNIGQVDYWIGREECNSEDQEESDGLPGNFEGGTAIIPTISSMDAFDPLPDSGGSRSGLLANVELQSQQKQVTTQGHTIIKQPTPHKESGDLGTNTSKLPAHASRNPSGSPLASGPYSTRLNRPTITPAQTARPPNKKRQMAHQLEDESESPSDYYGDEAIGQQPLQGRSSGGGQTTRFDNTHQIHHNSSQNTINIPPSHQTSNQQQPNPAKMMGTSAPGNPNLTATYPTEGTLEAEYRAFLDSYHSTGAPTAPHSGQLNTSVTLGYGHEGNDEVGRGESWGSISADTSPYVIAKSAHYASPDPYPPFNHAAIDFSLGHSGDLINNVDQLHQHSHRRSTIDSQQPQPLPLQMLALFPESFSSFESPNSMGIPLASSQQQQQYFSQDAHPYYSGSGAVNAGYNNGAQQQQQTQQLSSPDWMNQPSAVHNSQIAVEYSYRPPYTHHARPPVSKNQYTTHPWYQLHYQTMSGVAPGQISSNPGGSRIGMLANVGQQAQQQQQVTNTQGLDIIKQPASRKVTETGNLEFPARSSRNLSGASQTSGKYAAQQPNRPTIKPPVQTAKPPAKKRQRVQVPDEESESSSDYYGDEATGQQSRQGGSSAGGQSVRLLGACAPCKRLKMKCVFPEGQNDCCQRCRNAGRASLCVVGPRRPRQPSNKKELLLQKLREQDTVITSKDAVIKVLLEQVQNPHVHISLRNSPSIASGGGIPAVLQNAPHEEKPIDKAILEWIAKAHASIQSTLGFGRTDARLLEEDSSERSSELGKGLGGRDAMSPTKSKSSVSGSSGRLAAPDAAAGSHSIKSSPKLHSLPLETTPVGLLAELSLADNREKEKESQSKRSRSRSKSCSASGAEESTESRTGAGNSSAGGGGVADDGAIGVASRGYFQPAPTSNTGLTPNRLERKNIPEIMTSGLISPAEVDKLFKIYFDRLNVFISVLDPVLHTPATTFARCPFLFTVVCAIASRYHTERPELYSIAMHFARRAAASSLVEAEKSVELCQAYILMSVYSMPSRRWEDAREWVYLGLAIRMATDLNLHVKSTTKILNEHHERELLNRTRTWLNLYNLDCSTSAQLGRPASIRPDPIIRSCKEQGKRQAWWKSSPVNNPFDLHLCAYTDLMSSITAEFQGKVYWNPETGTTGLRTDLDLVKIAFQFDEKLQAWYAKTAVSFAAHSDSSSPQCAYRVQLLPFYANYLRLVILSLGLQQAMQKCATNIDPELVKRCLNAACGVVKTAVEDLAPTEYFRFAPDGHFVFSSFASAFLIKMLRPEHASLLDAERRTDIIDLVERLVGTLKSPRIAVDVRHTPMLYSRFLAGLLAKYRKVVDDGATLATTRTDTVGLLTSPPPTKKREIPQTSDLSGGREFNPTVGVSKHEASPSIEISPPGPDPASGAPTSQSHMIYDTPAADGLFPTQLTAEDSDASYTASTVHPASTIYASQYWARHTMMTDDGVLVPMLAMDAPGFWDSMMLPGIEWPAEDMQWATSLNDGLDSQLSHDTGHYQQGDKY